MRKRKYTKDILESVVTECTSYAQVVKHFDLRLTGGNYRLIQQRIHEYEINVSHFKGQGWAKGESKETSTSLKACSVKNGYSNADVFKKHSGYATSKLFARLIELGWENKCSNPNCTVTSSWLGNPIRLHVDHIDGNNTNHELSNLRFLCPNCHAQTDTYGVRNKRR